MTMSFYKRLALAWMVNIYLCVQPLSLSAGLNQCVQTKRKGGYVRKGGLALFNLDLTILFENTSVHVMCAYIHKITLAKIRQL